MLDHQKNVESLFELQKTAFEKRKEEGGEKALALVGDGLNKAFDAGFGPAGKEVVGLYRERFRLVREVQGEVAKGKEGNGDAVWEVDGRIRKAVTRVKAKLSVQ